MNIGGIGTPFNSCDADNATVDTTGGTLAAVFSDLTISKQREILLRNTGAVNLLIGKNSSGAKFEILPGEIITLAAKDLASVYIKAASTTCTASIFQAI